MQKWLRLLPLLALLFMGAAFRPALSIRFHVTTNQMDGTPFVSVVEVGNPPRKVYVKKIPEINEMDIAAIYPFKAADGTLGCALKLDDHGQIHLDTLSVEHRGTVLVCIVNGRVVTAMLVDQRITDGIIEIPSGLTPKDVEVMRKNYRLIGPRKPVKGIWKYLGYQ